MVFLHRFEQRGLGLRRRAIDFIGEHEIRKHRTWFESERLLSLLILHDDVRADDVGRHQVGCELNAGELEVHRFAQRSHEHGFAEPGHAFEQNVAAGKEGDEHAFDDLPLSDHHAADFVLHTGEDLAESFDLGGCCVVHRAG
jgi:hypothetical protein